MKLAWIKFFANDWLRDTRELSLAARGLWIDALCYMLNEPQRGIYTRSIRDACRALGCAETELIMAAKELGKVCSVTLSNDAVTLVSRRMLREANSYKNNANRQARFRRNAKSNAPITPKTLDSRLQTPQESERLESKSLLRSPSPSPSPDAPAQATARSAESALDKTKKLLQPLAIEQPVIPPEPEVIIPHSVELFFQGKCPCLMCERKIGWPLRGTR